jgi:hypothetical protein
MIAQKIVHTLRRRLDIQNTRNKHWYQSISDAQERRLKTSLSIAHAHVGSCSSFHLDQRNGQIHLLPIRWVYFSQAQDTMILEIFR